MKTNLRELLNEYYDTIFTFKHLYKNTIIYEKKYKNKIVTVTSTVDYRSDLDLEETLIALDCELEITNIVVTK